MNVSETNLPGVLVIDPDVFSDCRGFFLEGFHVEKYRSIGIEESFVQDNLSRSTRGTLRGLHAQRLNPQGKLVSVTKGAVFDVAVDINPESATFATWFGIELNDENHRQLWIPAGYAHGFQVLSDSADFFYKCTDLYHPEDEIGVIWNDSDLAISWPVTNPTVSEKDQRLPTIKTVWDDPTPDT